MMYAVEESLGIGAIIGAVSAGLIAIVSMWYTKKREVRQDEVAVLNQSIRELREDRDQMRTEFHTLQVTREEEGKARSLDMSKLKDEHTKCLIIQERLQFQVSNLEQQVALLRGGSREQARPAS